MIKKKLIITGCGIKSLSHLTKENEIAIKQAEKVCYLVNEPVSAAWIQKNSKSHESLEDLYYSEEIRSLSYQKIVNYILLELDKYSNLCVVVYGHPILLSDSINSLIETINEDIVELEVQPAISSFDCLLADLKIDTASGCYSIEANELLNNEKILDPTNHLIIWQIGILGNNEIYSGNSLNGLNDLKNKLLQIYDKPHKCILYEAAIYPHIPPKITETTIASIDASQLSRLTTAYIPPQVEISKSI